jgi:hypothetical protein
MSNSILVRHVQNLTDARYFSAMGVEWISLDLNEDPNTFHRWHSLKDWIAGPKLAAEMLTRDESVFARMIIDANPDGLISKLNFTQEQRENIQLFIEYDRIEQLDIFQNAFCIVEYYPDQIGAILALPPEKLFIQDTWNPGSILQLKNDGYKGGFCFESASEMTTGIRDFTLMDEMIEIIKE